MHACRDLTSSLRKNSERSNGPQRRSAKANLICRQIRLPGATENNGRVCAATVLPSKRRHSTYLWVRHRKQCCHVGWKCCHCTQSVFAQNDTRSCWLSTSLIVWTSRRLFTCADAVFALWEPSFKYHSSSRRGATCLINHDFESRFYFDCSDERKSATWKKFFFRRAMQQHINYQLANIVLKER